MTEPTGDLMTVEELERLFKDRYTEKDVDYQEHLANANLPPPAIPDWDKLNRNRFNRAGRRGSGRYRQGNHRHNSWD
uniref:RNMT-activating mini protein n=1 Tax=Trichobilharzia regenti TaxID=157069 RepID=A0AA85K092_TRIRE|nr:unnamed protein product [Trichobilharzia regenti]